MLLDLRRRTCALSVRHLSAGFDSRLCAEDPKTLRGKRHACCQPNEPPSGALDRARSRTPAAARVSSQPVALRRLRRRPPRRDRPLEQRPLAGEGLRDPHRRDRRRATVAPDARPQACRAVSRPAARVPGHPKRVGGSARIGRGQARAHRRRRRVGLGGEADRRRRAANRSRRGRRLWAGVGCVESRGGARAHRPGARRRAGHSQVLRRSQPALPAPARCGYGGWRERRSRARRARTGRRG
jgi:hypothetical protein